MGSWLLRWCISIDNFPLWLILELSLPSLDLILILSLLRLIDGRSFFLPLSHRFFSSILLTWGLGAWNEGIFEAIEFLLLLSLTLCFPLFCDGWSTNQWLLSMLLSFLPDLLFVFDISYTLLANFGALITFTFAVSFCCTLFSLRKFKSFDRFDAPKYFEFLVLFTKNFKLLESYIYSVTDIHI
jgi:hypothetical protein